MDIKSVVGEVQGWSVEDRLQLVEGIWDSLASVEHAGDIGEGMKQLLDSRLAAAAQSPDQAVPWDVVEARAMNRFSK